MKSDEIAELYQAEKPLLETVEATATTKLRLACLTAGIACRTESRVKAFPSVMRKLMFSTLKYRQIVDKVGLRVVLRYVDQFPVLQHEVVEKTFTVLKHVDVATRLKNDQFGYSGQHFHLALGDDVPPGAPTGTGTMKFELQVHTEPQSVWATISHGLVYKPDVADATVTRGMARLAALLETSDLEVVRLRDAVAANPDMRGARVLRVLEDAYLPMAHQPYDPELNLRVVKSLESTVSFDNIESWEAEFRTFVKQFSTRLLRIVEDYRDDTRNPLVCQPAGLLVLFAYDRDKFILEERWPDWISASIFESFKGIWS